VSGIMPQQITENRRQGAESRLSTIVCHVSAERGFSMVELISVIVISGILAAIAAPKFFNNDAFESRGFYDQVLSTLRYAQQEAVAQHRNVCVTIANTVINAAYTTTDITLNIASNNGSATACSTVVGAALVSPAGQDGKLGYAYTNCTQSLPSSTYKICTPPVGTSPNFQTSPITITSTSSTFGFDAYGRTLDNIGTVPTLSAARKVITLSDANCTSDPLCTPKYIYVEAETGYVH